MTHPAKAVVAVPMVLFLDNLIAQSFVNAGLELYLKLRKNLRLHIDDSVENFYNNQVRSPALILSSKTDMIGTDEFSRRVVERWRVNGVNVTYKCFEDSQHVRHMQQYPEEYLKLLRDHWERVKLLERE